MSSHTESEAKQALEAELRELGNDWRWFFALGIGLVVGGVVALTVPLLTTVGAVTIMGILMVFAGAAQIVSAFTSANWRGGLLHVLVGILYGVVGFLVLENPIEGAAGFTLLVAVMFLVEGIFRMVFALRERFPSWGWTLLNGAVSLLLGLIIWRQFPASTLWVIGILVGIDLIFAGWGWIMLAMTVRRFASD